MSHAAHLPPAFPDRAAWGTATKLRAWQQRALDDYLARSPRDYLAVATPGAGKTTFALRVAADLLARRVVQRVIVVAPTEHLKVQWAQAAEVAGIPIDPSYTGKQGRTSRDYVGFALTYAGVATNPLAYRVRTEQHKTLVVLDEIHHAGDALSWGEAVREAFEPATKRLALTGTPFRSDANPIPFVTYAPGDDGIPRSAADYTYGYAHALRDGVVRPVLFMAYSGEMRWRTRAGDEVAAHLAEPLTKDLTAQALRTALAPDGAWMPAVLEAADRRLSEVRRHVPDAGGLVIATDQESARAYARLLRQITGERPTVVLSDERASSRRIGEFAASESRWMVAVRMVSEGVDVPRLAVGVYATTTATPLFFAQAVGRFVRARRRGETASVFLPSVGSLLGFAADMEVERDHVLGRRVESEDDLFAAEDRLVAAAQAEQSTATDDDDQLSFEAVESQATFDRVVYDGGDYGVEGGALVGSEEEADFLGIPGLLEPDQVRTLLNRRQADRLARQRRGRRSPGRPDDGGAGPDEHATGPEDRAARPGERGAGPGERGAGPEERGAGPGERGHGSAEGHTHARIGALRRELNGLVGAWHHRTGQPHGVIHNELRRSTGGPPAPQASAEELRTRIDLIREWAVRPR